MPHTHMTLATQAGDLTVGFARIRDEAGLATQYPASAVSELSTPPSAGPQRRDLRDLPLHTLDPPGSMDLDQALHLERLPRGYRVHYAIADVAAFVRPGGALDAEANRRGTTVYCPDARVPLHPPQLAEDAGSLLPDRDRPAVVWRVDLADDGAIVDWDLTRAIVRSRRRDSYPDAQRSLDEDPDGPWRLLREVGEARIAQERARGGVSLSLPEQLVTRDGDRWRLSFRAVPAVEEFNAQLSLLTGQVAARIMLEGGCGILRTMPPAPPERLATLRRQAAALGISWREGERYGDVLARVSSDTPAGAAFLTAAASLFRGAAWTAFDGAVPEQPEHAAIAAPYAHVTAPLRRLVDRYATEICLALHASTPVPGWVRDELGGIGETMASAARRDGEVDRACTELVEAATLHGLEGAEFPGVAITEKSIQIAEPAVVARCRPAVGDALPLGARLRAQLIAADLQPVKVEFRQLP